MAEKPEVLEAVLKETVDLVKKFLHVLIIWVVLFLCFSTWASDFFFFFFCCLGWFLKIIGGFCYVGWFLSCWLCRKAYLLRKYLRIWDVAEMGLLLLLLRKDGPSLVIISLRRKRWPLVTVSMYLNFDVFVCLFDYVLLVSWNFDDGLLVFDLLCFLGEICWIIL